MFPAAINIYWCTVSLVQLATVGMLHTKYFKQQVGLITKPVKPKIRKDKEDIECLMSQLIFKTETIV